MERGCWENSFRSTTAALACSTLVMALLPLQKACRPDKSRLSDWMGKHPRAGSCLESVPNIKTHGDMLCSATGCNSESQLFNLEVVGALPCSAPVVVSDEASVAWECSG